MRGGQMGTVDMKTDMQRMQQIHDQLKQWSEMAMNHARETKNPYAWCTYMSLSMHMDANMKQTEMTMQAMKEEQNQGMEQQMSQMHTKLAPAMMGMMGEKMRM